MHSPKTASVRSRTIFFASAFYVVCLAVTGGCSSESSSSQSEVKSQPDSGKADRTLSRPVTASDLIITVPRVSETAPASGHFLALTDVVGEDNARSILSHLLMRTPQEPLTGPDDIDHEQKIGAKNFWGLPLDSPDLVMPTRNAMALRLCNEDFKSWSVGAIRFAPAESLLPGSPADWKAVARGAPVSNGIQLRFSLRNSCLDSSDDAGIHVIYTLGSDEFKETLKLPGKIKGSFLAGNKAEALADADKYLKKMSTPEYENFRTSTIDEWLTMMDGLKLTEREKALTWDELPSKFLTNYREKGFKTLLDEVMSITINKPKAGDGRLKKNADLGMLSLATRDSAASAFLREKIKSLISDKGRLSHATVFFGSGMDNWNFGALGVNESNMLEAEKLQTVDTFFQSEGRTLQDIEVKLTSAAGLYESISQFEARSDAGGSGVPERTVPDWNAFRKTNVLFSLNGGGVVVGSDPSVAFVGDGDAQLMERVMDTTRVNASNMTCSGCHLSLVTQREHVGPKKSGIFEMLNGVGEQLNTRTAAELTAEVEALNAGK